jgi:oligoendopeptidase F
MEHSHSFNLLILHSDDVFFEALMARELFKPSEFEWRINRKNRDYLLSLKEENLITSLSLNGPAALSNLWTTMTGSMQVLVGSQSMGLASAASLLRSDNEPKRKEAYLGLKAAWEDRKDICASVLNSLAGWRITENEKRSQISKKTYLTSTLNGGRLQLETLNAMHEAVRKRRSIGQKAIQIQAKILAKPKLDPWDLLGGYPSGNQKPLPWSEALEIVTSAFSAVSPQKAEFVKMMAREKLIEATVGDKKRLGAYCANFAKTRTPVVYMTWQGSNGDLRTLAHELGHAWHSWTMRDMNLELTKYPMTLAETASIFGETLVDDYLLSKSKSPQENMLIHWNRAEAASGFLLNIPARFIFEENVMIKRSAGVLTAHDFVKLNREAWAETYGDSLSECDPYFWASKLHFYMWPRSFYNYPYTYGYLFALGVYGKFLEDPAHFSEKYTALLRDTGRMSCEDIARKHLNTDITKEDFWHSSLDVVERQMNDFERDTKALNQ